MAKFRKKPIVIEAFRFGIDTAPKWFMDKVQEPHVILYMDRVHPERSECLIKTLEGDMSAIHGDWIIKGVKGELSPCTPYTFNMLFEPVT